MSLLFEPHRINSMVVGNRFVRSATGEGACREGHISEAYRSCYRTLARGGIGLIITGHASVTEEGRTHDKMTGIHDDRFIPALQELTQSLRGNRAVSAAGEENPVRIAMQINHRGMEPPDEINRLSAREVERILQAFVEAARRVKQAGFDAVQVHNAHGYIVSQFLDPCVNRRTDRWAGTELSEEILRRTRDAVGPEYPVLIKMNCDGLSSQSLSSDEGAAIAAALAEAGADAIEVSGADAMRKDIRDPQQEAYFATYARRIREAVSVPVILVGGLRSAAIMEQHLSQGTADFVALCRPFIREPDLLRRYHRELLSGNTDATADCISCSLCWSSPETANRCGVLEKNP